MSTSPVNRKRPSTGDAPPALHTGISLVTSRITIQPLGAGLTFNVGALAGASPGPVVAEAPAPAPPPPTPDSAPAADEFESPPRPGFMEIDPDCKYRPYAGDGMMVCTSTYAVCEEDDEAVPIYGGVFGGASDAYEVGPLSRIRRPQWEANNHAREANINAGRADPIAFGRFKASIGEKQLNKDLAEHTIKALFTIPESTVASFLEHAVGKRAHVIMVIDDSPSMNFNGGQGIKGAKEAMAKFADHALAEGAPVELCLHVTTFNQVCKPFKAEWCNITADVMKEKCLQISQELEVPADSNGTNHESAMMSAFEYANSLVDFPTMPTHVIFLTDGNATVGQTNPVRLQEMMDEELALNWTEKQIVFHTLVVGSETNRVVPKKMCESTGGIVACALNPEKLPEEMSKLIGPIREAPAAIIMKIEWGGGSQGAKTTYQRHGLLTKNHRHVLTEVTWHSATQRRDHPTCHLSIIWRDFECCKLFFVKPAVELETVVVPDDLKKELEAKTLLEELAAQQEDALRNEGARAMASLARHMSASAPVQQMPEHLRRQFDRRAVMSETFSEVIVSGDVPEEPNGASGTYRSFGSAPPALRRDGNAAALTIDSMSSQADY